MYARRKSTREIVGHLRDLYGIDISPHLIRAVTDAVWRRSLGNRLSAERSQRNRAGRRAASY
jgi:transposase-like protein